MAHYQVPPLVKVQGIAVIAAAGNFTLLAAPGVGFRHRIVRLSVNLPRTAAAGTFEFNFQDGVGGTSIWFPALSQPALWSDRMDIPGPGILLSDNTLFNVNAGASIAGPTACRVNMLYYTDAVS